MGSVKGYIFCQRKEQSRLLGQNHPDQRLSSQLVTQICKHSDLYTPHAAHLLCLRFCSGTDVTAFAYNVPALGLLHLSGLLSMVAGPERSGSTWLFNAVRLLLKSAHVPYDPYWITTLSTDKLNQRKRLQND